MPRPGLTAAKHAGIAFVLMIAVAAVAGPVLGVKDGYKLGYKVGQFAMPVMLMVYFVSYLYHTQQRFRAALIGGGIGLLLIAAWAVGQSKGDKGVALSAAEKEPLRLKRSGQGKIFYHPAVGFSFRYPGEGFQLMPHTPQHRDLMRKNVGIYVYQLQDRDTGQTVIVLFRKSTRLQRRYHQDFLKGFYGSLKRRYPRVRQVQVQASWEPRRKETLAHYQSRRLHFLSRILSKKVGLDKQSYTVFLQCISRDLEWARRIAHSLEFSMHHGGLSLD